MNGGTVQMGLTREDAAALARASGEELVKQLARITERISAQIGLVRSQSIALGVVEGFLASIKGRSVPESEWPEVFGELARQCQLLKDREPKSAAAESPADGPLGVQAKQIDWRDGVLEFKSAPLSEVVSELNHFSRRRIEIADRHLEDVMFGGRLHVRDISATLFLLAQVTPISITLSDDAFVLRYRQ